jgi:cation diffusion facilitator CzcD-associated flavoprotein CzcO
MRYVPLAMRLYRLWIYLAMESDFYSFKLTEGRQVRESLRHVQTAYIKANAPEKYHAALVPSFEIGCKRKVMDTDYLACLHQDNVELIHSDPIEEISENGVRTRSGAEIAADAIVLANGFETQQLLHPLKIEGRGGRTLNEHVGQSTISP